MYNAISLILCHFNLTFVSGASVNLRNMFAMSLLRNDYVAKSFVLKTFLFSLTNKKLL